MSDDPEHGPMRKKLTETMCAKHPTIFADRSIWPGCLVETVPQPDRAHEDGSADQLLDWLAEGRDPKSVPTFASEMCGAI